MRGAALVCLGFGVLQVLACSGEDRPGFLENPNSEVELICDGGSCRPADCDAGDCRTPVLPRTGTTIEATSDRCMSEADAEEYADEPLRADVRIFATDAFDPDKLELATGDAKIRAASRRDGLWACAEGLSFSLIGGATSIGSLIIEPEEPEDANFVPTVLWAPRTNQTLGEIPVFGKEDIEAIFEQVDIEPNPERGHLLFEFVYATPDDRLRQAGIEVKSPGGTVVYRNGGEWTRELSATTDDGIAMVINAGAQGGLGGEIDVNYYVHPERPDDATTIAGLTSLRGAVTYVAVTPVGRSAPGAEGF